SFARLPKSERRDLSQRSDRNRARVGRDREGRAAQAPASFLYRMRPDRSATEGFRLRSDRRARAGSRDHEADREVMTSSRAERSEVEGARGVTRRTEHKIGRSRDKSFKLAPRGPSTAFRSAPLRSG